MKTALLFILFPLYIFGQTQIGQDIDGQFASEESGDSLSLSSDGTILAVGSENHGGSGEVLIFEIIGNTWTPIGDPINGEALSDGAGGGVSLSSDGNIVAVGSPFNDGVNGVNSGHVRVFQNQGGIWTQIGDDIDGEDEYNSFGGSVVLSSDGSIVAIGARENDGVNGVNSGHVRVFENLGGTWTQIGDDIDGEAEDDLAGAIISLSSDGSIVAIGSFENDGNGSGAGHVRVFENIGGVWTQVGEDIDGSNSENFGHSVSLSSDGTIIAVGAIQTSNSGALAGQTRIYKNEAGVWTQIGNNIDGEAEQNLSGWSVSLSSSGTVVAIGAIHNADNGIKAGHVRIYKNIGDVWIQAGNDIDGEAEDDLSGYVVSLSSDGKVVVISAPRNDGNGQNSGHVRAFDLSSILSVIDTSVENFIVYPNPATQTLQVELNPNSVLEKITLYNSLGQVVQIENSLNFNLSSLAAGTYYLEVSTNIGVNTKQIIVE